MSYITFDYRCSRCEVETTKLVKRNVQDFQRCECGMALVKLPPSPRTHFRFNDTKLKE